MRMYAIHFSFLFIIILWFEPLEMLLVRRGLPAVVDAGLSGLWKYTGFPRLCPPYLFFHTDPCFFIWEISLLPHSVRGPGPFGGL